MDIVLLVIRYVLQALMVAIFLRAIMSWVFPGNPNVFTDILYHITEPILAPIRKILPSAQGFDFSPTVALVILMIIMMFLR